MTLPRSLIDRFAAHLVVMLDEVQALESRLAATADMDDGGWETLRGLAHKLAGTATPFGYPDLERSARAMEAVVLDRESSHATRIEAARALREALTKACLNPL